MTSGMSVANVDEAISVARFNQHLLSLVNEQDSSSRRIEELEKALQQAQAQHKSQVAQTASVEGKLREETGRREESNQERLRAEKAAEDERSRHALTRRSHESSSVAVLAKISEQGQQIHSLEEMLRAKESECAKLKLVQESAEGLIGTFREKVAEVGKMADLAAESERCCKEALSNVRDDQARIRSLLETCKERQSRAASSELLEQQLRAAQAEVGEEQMRTTQCEERLQQALEQLARVQEAEASARASGAEVQAQCDHQHTQLQRAEQQMQMHGELLNRALKNGMKVGEKNEQLVDRLLRSDAMVKLLQRELMHAEAETKGMALHASAGLEAQAARVRTAEAREATLSEQLKHALQELDGATAQVSRLQGAVTALEERLAAAAPPSLAATESEAAAAPPPGPLAQHEPNAAAPATAAGGPTSASSVAEIESAPAPATLPTETPAAEAAESGRPSAYASPGEPQRAASSEPQPAAPTHAAETASDPPSAFPAEPATEPLPHPTSNTQAPRGYDQDTWMGTAYAGGSSNGAAHFQEMSDAGFAAGSASDSVLDGGSDMGAWAGVPALGHFDGSGTDGWTRGGVPPVPVEPPAACQAPVAAPVASCGKCREPLYGACSTCGKCGKACKRRPLGPPSPTDFATHVCMRPRSGSPRAVLPPQRAAGGQVLHVHRLLAEKPSGGQRRHRPRGGSPEAAEAAGGREPGPPASSERALHHLNPTEARTVVPHASCHRRTWCRTHPYRIASRGYGTAIHCGVSGSLQTR